MEISKGYKQTEVGVIPQDWEVRKVSDIFSFLKTNTLSRDSLNYYAGEVKNVHYGDILVKYGEILNADEKEIPYINFDTKLGSNPSYLQSGDIIMADTAEDEVVGKSSEIINVSEKIVSGLHTMVLRPQTDFAPKYLGYFFNSSLYHDQLLPYMQGIKVLSLSKTAVGQTYIIYPKNINEQIAISSSLSEIDELMAGLGEQIEKKRQIKEGAMQQLLTGKTRLPGFTQPWREVQIGKIGYTYPGITGKSKDDFNRGDARYITFLNVLNNPVIDTSIFERVNISPTEGQNAAHKGDLFFNTSSETPEEVGICAVLNDEIQDLYLNSFCFGYRLTDDSVLGHYLAYFWRSKRGREIMTSLAQGATRYNLSKAYFNKVNLTIPQTKDEQIAIVDVLNTMDDEICQLEAEHDKYTLIKQGMMQELLTGKIRLV